MPLFSAVKVTLNRTNAIPADAVVNVWHFDADDATGEANDLADRVAAFYTTIAPIMSSVLSGTGTIQVYDLADPEPRVPIYTRGLTGIAGGSAFPSEVALCLSMQAAPESGVNQRRRRGRIYIGPLGTGGTAVTDGDVRPTQARADTILDAAVTLATGPDPGDSRLAIYSPTTRAGGASLADSFNDAAELWVDNAFDTQRRRGARPTTRWTRDL